MDVISICVLFIVAILGIAYPILFQVVAGLDEKYSSILILDLFNGEKVKKYFNIFLFTSLISIIIWIFRQPPRIEIEGLNFLIENSATYLLLANTIVLILTFFFFIEKILIYYTPSRFLKYLIDKHKKDKKASNYIYFKAISDLLYFSIQKQNETISRTISDFMYWAFQNQRDIDPEKPIEYPTAYYEVVNKSIEELTQLKNKKLTFLEYQTAGGIWLLGEIPGSKIHESTYFWLWYNLYLASEYEKDDMIMYYWQNAHQFISFNLNEIFPKYSEDYEIINKNSIEERKKERERFLEFPYALGGLLLYKKHYECIARIFKYTSSIPPRFELLPKSMNDVFNFFMHFLDPYDMSFNSISFKYNFPNLEGQLANSVIKKWICEYIVVLFLRQYIIASELNSKLALGLPTLPTNQSEKIKWINNLGFFKKLIRNVLNNQSLLSCVGLTFLTDKWCADNNQLKPLELIDQLKYNLEESFDKTLVEQEISDKKLQKFYDSTKSILNDTINSYKKIYNPRPLQNEYNSCFILGERVILGKSAFAEYQGSDNLNYDTFIAERISSKYGQGVAETFFLNKSDKYLLKSEDIFLAIDKLKISKNADEFIIVGFGQNISYFKNSLNIPQLDGEKYKNIELINFLNYDRRQFGQMIFIIKKTDLPHFEFTSVDKQQIEKYSLSEVDKIHKIYSSVVDLNSNKDLRKELEQTETDSDLRKSVLVNISLRVEIQWKKNIENVLIQTYSPQRERGLLDNLNDVKKF